MAKVVTISGVDFPCRQLKWKELRQLNDESDADKSNDKLYKLMNFTKEHMAQIEELAVGDVYELHRLLFQAATAPTEAQEKN
jgi:hypothetical protein